MASIRLSKLFVKVSQFLNMNEERVSLKKLSEDSTVIIDLIISVQAKLKFPRRHVNFVELESISCTLTYNLGVTAHWLEKLLLSLQIRIG